MHRHQNELKIIRDHRHTTYLSSYKETLRNPQPALRYVVGLIGVLILWRGLALFLPDNADLISYVLRYVRYTLVGFWVSGGAPWLFFRFKLADKPKM